MCQRYNCCMAFMLYIAPERAKWQPFNHKSDIFSMGIVFYQLVTGQHPFGEWREFTKERVLLAIKNSLFVDHEWEYTYTNQNGGVMPLWIPCVSMMLMHDPDQRGTIEQLLGTKYITKYNSVDKDQTDYDYDYDCERGHGHGNEESDLNSPL